MKNIILQHYDGELGTLEKLSVENIKTYAKYIGADYKLVLGKPFNQYLIPSCQKLIILDEMFDGWDNVLMIDIDVFATKTTKENVFDYPGIGLHGEVQKSLHRRIAQEYPLLASSSAPYWGGAFYKMDKTTRKKLRDVNDGDDFWMHNFSKRYHYEDEGIFHVLARRAGFKAEGTYADLKWCLCSYLPEVDSAKFIHIRTKVTPNGPKRTKLENYQALVDKGII